MTLQAFKVIAILPYHGLVQTSCAHLASQQLLSNFTRKLYVALYQTHVFLHHGSFCVENCLWILHTSSFMLALPWHGLHVIELCSLFKFLVFLPFYSLLSMSGS